MAAANWDLFGDSVFPLWVSQKLKMESCVTPLLNYIVHLILFCDPLLTFNRFPYFQQYLGTQEYEVHVLRKGVLRQKKT